MLQHGADGADEEFPREWHSHGADYPLTYPFEPGGSDDGVTVDLPVEQVMSVESSFSWGVPGHRLELVTELIKSLPKRLRREFVPATQYAPRLLAAMDPSADDLSEELARQMRLLNGTLVSADDFDFEALPSHLRVTFRVVDGERELARGKDLDELRERVGRRVRAELTKAAAGGTCRAPLVGRRRHPARSPRAGHRLPGAGGRRRDGRAAGPGQPGRAAGRHGPRPGSIDLVPLPTPVPAIGRSLDMRAKLLLATGPYADPAA